MKHHLPFTYLACQTCQAKIHCDQCGDTLTQSLQQQGLAEVALNMNTKQLTVEGDVDSDDIEACLEDLGIFLS